MLQSLVLKYFSDFSGLATVGFVRASVIEVNSGFGRGLFQDNVHEYFNMLLSMVNCTKLVGDLEHFLFSIIYGTILPID